jgi:hypothetical protein
MEYSFILAYFIIKQVQISTILAQEAETLMNKLNIVFFLIQLNL